MYSNNFLRKGAWEVNFLSLDVSENVFYSYSVSAPFGIPGEVYFPQV